MKTSQFRLETVTFFSPGELYYQVQHFTKKMTVHINLCYNKFTTTKITRRNI